MRIAIVIGVVLGLGSSPAMASVHLGWSAPALIDSQQPFGNGSGINLMGVSCPGTNLCVAIDQDGEAVASSDPTASSPTYTKTPVVSGGVGMRNPIDCPTSSFCIVIAGHDVYSSQDPSVGAWSSAQEVDTDSTLTSISCDPTASVCVAVDGAGNEFTTIDPTDASPTWVSKPIDGVALNGVSCPSTTLCVAVDASGYSISSADPGDPTPIWTSELTSRSGSIFGVSCAPTTTTCVAITGGDPNVLMTATPTGSWNSETIDAGEEDVSVSCGSATLCVVGSGGYGTVLLTNDPGSSTPTWSDPLNLSTRDATVDAGCAPTFCVAVDDDGELDSAGDVITSNQNPTSASSTWTALRPDGTDALTAVTCPTTALCVAGDNAGDLLTTDNPTAASPSWTVAHADPGIEINAISCDPTASLCVAVDNYGQALSSTDPTAGKPTWSAPVQITYSSLLNAISCPSASLCFAVDGDGDVLTSTDPTSKAIWSSNFLLTDDPGTKLKEGFVSLSCPSTGFCLAGWDSNKGHWGVSSSTDPADPSSWVTSTSPGTAGYVTSVSCASSSFCAASATGLQGVPSWSGSSGVLATADPNSSQPTWAFTAAPAGLVACPNAAFCLAAHGPNTGIGSTATADGAELLAGSPTSWSDTDADPDPNAPLAGVSCPTAAFCVSVDGAGFAMSGTVSSALSLTIGGTGSGRVTSAGLSCSSSCNATYEPGTVVTLTAAPDPGSVFAGWSGGPCSGSSTCQITMSDDQSISARFETASSLHVSITGKGSVTGSEINCPGICVAEQPRGPITLSAAPAPGYRFAGWSGGTCTGVGTCTPNVSRATDVAAVFEPVPPRCQLALRGADVHLTSRKQHGARITTGTIRAAATCNQLGNLTLSGDVVEQGRQGHANRTFRLATRRLALRRAGAVVLSLRLPAAAVRALVGRAHESLGVALTEINTTGVAHASAKINTLRET